MLIRTTLVLLSLMLSACTGIKIDQRYQSSGYDNRVQWVVLHYTSADFSRSVELLTGPHVSSHYLLDDTRIYQLIDEKHRAWHAGRSAWHGRTWLNSTSIGIEMVHPGYLENEQGREWIPWSAQQVDLLMPLLVDIQARYQLPIDSVVGHSDIAPQRKVDPGPLFPWFRLAQAGMIRWPLHADIQQQIEVYTQQLPNALWFQEQLQRIGYSVELSGEFDQQTENVLRALQMKFRPRLFDGQVDAETAAILWSLVQQHDNA